MITWEGRLLRSLCLMLCAKATHKSGQTAQLMNCKGVQRDRVGDWPTGESGAIHKRIATHTTPLMVSKSFWDSGQGCHLKWLLSAPSSQQNQSLSCHLNSRALACSIWAGLRPLLPSLLHLPLSSVLRCIGSMTKTMIQVYRAQPGGDA